MRIDNREPGSSVRLPGDESTKSMKVVILAGGLGTRLSEETSVRPKPMVEIGGKPILWHIMKHYAHHGFCEFVIALGHLGDSIKRYFLEYSAVNSDLTVDTATGEVEFRSQNASDDWKVHLIDTGPTTMTGGRLRRLKDVLGDETFMLTYGDGVSDVDLSKLLEFHRDHGRSASVTAVRPAARFGGLRLERDEVAQFTEKPQVGEGWINGGFFVMEPTVLSYISGDDSVLEREALESLASERQLMAYCHEGFWQCMDTLRERRILEELWAGGNPPWRSWEAGSDVGQSIRKAA